MTRSFALISCFIAGILPAFAQQNADFLKPSSTIKIDLLANHYLHVSRDGFTAIDVLSKYSFVTIDLTNSLQQKKSLTDPLAFNFRTSEASQHNIATVMSDKRVDASSQMYLYSFIDLTKGEKLFDALMIVKKKGNNYLGELVGTKYKKIDGQDRFLIVMRFKNVFDNSVILKGWLMKKDGLVPPIIAYESPDAIFELSKPGFTEPKSFDCTNDGKLAVLAFDKNTLVFTAESKKWDQLSFKKDAASLAFFTAEGFLFTLIETYSEDDCVIWDPLTRKKIKSLDLDWSTDSKIRFSEHGGYAAVWDGHNNIRIWNINTENIIATLMVPTVADRSIQREDVPRDYLIGDGPQAIDASSDLKTIIVYSTIAENIVYDEASKQGTYDIAHQLIDVFRISELLAGSKDELIGKQKR